MANVIEKAVEAWKDLQNPKGELEADVAKNTIVNNLLAGEASLSAMDSSVKKGEVQMNHEVMSALSQRYERQGIEALADLKNPEGKLTAKAAERLINYNFEESDKYITALSFKGGINTEKEQAELKELLSKRYVRQGLSVLDDLKDPKGELDANVARLLIQSNFKDAKAHDTSAKKIEEEMTPIFEDALSKRYVRQGLEAWADLTNPEGKLTAKEAEGIIKDNFRDGKVTLAALDTSRKKSEKEMTAEFNEAFSKRAARADKQWSFNPDAIIEFIERLGKKDEPASSNNLDIPRQFTPTFQGEVAPSAKR
ncbi:MAG: hypothetical protein AABY33_00575 [Pseudomonadota bacterium]